MKYLRFSLIGCLFGLAGCTATLNNGNDTSFERQGQIECPSGTVQSGLRGDERNPLRCGPQVQR